MKKKNTIFIKFILYTISISLLLGISSCEKKDPTSPYHLDIELSAPTDFSITQTSLTSCKLSWTDNVDGEQGYIIARKKDNDNWVSSYQVLNANTKEFIDENLSINSTYMYRLLAYADENKSTYQEAELIITFPSPTNLEITQTNNTSCQLSWYYSGFGDEEGFKIKRRNGGNDWTEIAQLGINEFSYEDTDLIEAETYEYMVFAYNVELDGNETVYEITLEFEIEGMIFVEGGTYEMGYRLEGGINDETPVHDVTVSSFFIGQYEITHTKYIEFLNSLGVSSNGSYNGTELIDMNDSDCAIDHNGSFYFGGSSYASDTECPVIEVTWYGAVVYCNWLSEQEGLTPCYNTTSWSCDFTADGYRLPTEAEWEYAARGGVHNLDNYEYSGSDIIGDVAVYSSNDPGGTAEVGSKDPNQLEIYDMSGNVWEWCWDEYDSSYYQECYDQGTVTNPTGGSGSYRVFRGGSWNHDAGYCRVAHRNYYYNSDNRVGFRILRANPMD